MELKAEFAQMAAQPSTNMSRLCRRFGISRPTGYKWLRRYKKNGLDGLHERSRRPNHSPGKTPDAVEKVVVEARLEDPGWGGRKLCRHLVNQAKAGEISIRPNQIPSPTTITRILNRHGLLSDPDHPDRRGAWTRFERSTPNELWQMDFKGEFRLADQTYCYPLTLIDDYSRFSLAVAGCPNQKRKTVQAQLNAVFVRYGLPQAILCDNGPPWGAGLGWRQWGPFYTGLAVWMIRLGITLIYGTPNHPQGKGKNERFNGTLQSELLDHEQFEDYYQADKRMRQWRDRYNTIRPHQALDMATPASRYRPSQRPLPDELPDVNYGQGAITRKVNSAGRISVDNQRFTVGNAFRGFAVELRAGSKDQHYDIYFCNQQIRSINLNQNHNKKV